MEDSKRTKITIQAGETFRWRKGLCLQAIESSSFMIPGALFRKGEKMSAIMELSNDETEVVFLGKPAPDANPNLAVILKPGDSMQLNRNSEVIHIHLKGEVKHAKEFVVLDG